MIITKINNIMTYSNETKQKAYDWYCSLSINEQKEYISKHPFFGKMSMDYFRSHKTSIIQLYEYNVHNLNK